MTPERFELALDRVLGHADDEDWHIPLIQIPHAHLVMMAEKLGVVPDHLDWVHGGRVTRVESKR